MLQVFLDYLLVLIAFMGSSISAYIDLKTTEIPDEIPLAMAITGLLIRFGYSLFTGEWYFLLIPSLVGAGFFLFGMLMYWTGQWGGGDAKLLGAIGIMIGILPGIIEEKMIPFYFNYLLNVFFVGAIYIVFYAFVISMKNKKVVKGFYKSLHESKTELYVISVLSLLIFFATTYFYWNMFSSFNIINIFLSLFFIGFYILWKFLKSVETIGFMKKINVKDLREGDMIGEDIKKLNISKKIIRGLTKEEVMKIKKLRKTVWIREGVRFGPVFPIAILVTLFFGNLLILLMQIV